MSARYSEEFKAQVIRRYQEGDSLKNLSKELHIAQSTLYKWRNKYCAIQTPTRTYTPAEFDSIYRKLRRMEHEKQVLRLTDCLSDIPLQKKLTALEKLYHEPENPFSVGELCGGLDVAKGTFYNHIFRRADKSKREDENLQLMMKIRQIFEDSKQRFGADKIHAVLRENDIRVSEKRVSALMKELGLRSI